jgi:biopolymer transport protein ExbD
MHQDAVTFGATMRDKIIVLSVSGHAGVDLNGVKLDSTSEVAQALEKMRIDSPDATVSIEADGSAHYEAIGKAIYGSHRAGFVGDRLRIVIDGKLLPSGNIQE